jgi:hypothetical protein
MHRPSKRAVEFSTKFIEQHLNELQSSVPEDDERIFDEVAPHLNVAPKRQVAADLPKIEVKPLAADQAEANGSEHRRHRIHIPVHASQVRTPPPVIPDDYGYDDMTDQLLDLVFQFTRLSTLDVVSDQKCQSD